MCQEKIFILFKEFCFVFDRHKHRERKRGREIVFCPVLCCPNVYTVRARPGQCQEPWARSQQLILCLLGGWRWANIQIILCCLLKCMTRGWMGNSLARIPITALPLFKMVYVALLQPLPCFYFSDGPLIFNVSFPSCVIYCGSNFLFYYF